MYSNQAHCLQDEVAKLNVKKSVLSETSAQ